jgi:hypothetical protein
MGLGVAAIMHWVRNYLLKRLFGYGIGMDLYQRLDLDDKKMIVVAGWEKNVQSYEALFDRDAAHQQNLTVNQHGEGSITKLHPGLTVGW